MNNIKHFQTELVNIIGEDSLQKIQQFHIVYSRFEFTLLNQGLIQKNKIYADWWEFAKQLDTSFDKSSSEELKNACNYIESQPPLKFNGITWQSIDLKNNICTCEKLIRYIQTIRNNLFHGGKNPFDTIRDSKLINSSLIILDYCISISPHNIKTAFWSGLTAPEI